MNEAIAQWRGDNRRTANGPLSPEETAALLAQPVPEFFAVVAGNPYQGMGLAMRHKTRTDAEAEAVNLCVRSGGDRTKICARLHVASGANCMFMYAYKIDNRRERTIRTSLAMNTDLAVARAQAHDGCGNGSPHAAKCEPVISFCADGSKLQLFDAGQRHPS